MHSTLCLKTNSSAYMSSPHPQKPLDLSRCPAQYLSLRYKYHIPSRVLMLTMYRRCCCALPMNSTDLPAPAEWPAVLPSSQRAQQTKHLPRPYLSHEHMPDTSSMPTIASLSHSFPSHLPMVSSVLSAQMLMSSHRCRSPSLSPPLSTRTLCDHKTMMPAQSSSAQPAVGAQRPDAPPQTSHYDHPAQRYEHKHYMSSPSSILFAYRSSLSSMLSDLSHCSAQYCWW